MVGLAALTHASRGALVTVADTCSFQPATRVGLPTMSHGSCRCGLTPSARRRVANSPSAVLDLALAARTSTRVARAHKQECLSDSTDRSLVAALARHHRRSSATSFFSYSDAGGRYRPASPCHKGAVSLSHKRLSGGRPWVGTCTSGIRSPTLCL